MKRAKTASKKNYRDQPYAKRVGAVRAGFHQTQRTNRGKASKRRALATLNSRVAGFLGIESKFFDSTFGPTNVPQQVTWVTCMIDPLVNFCLSAPAEGDGPTNRDGKKCIITSVFVNGMVTFPPYETQTDPNRGGQVFIALVLDTQTNGAQTNSNTIYTNTSAAVTGNAVPLRALEYSSRYRILKTWLIDANLPGVTQNAVNDYSGGGKMVEFSCYVQNLNIAVNFTAAAAGVASVMDNSLHLFANSSSTSAAYNPTILYNSRIRFQG